MKIVAEPKIIAFTCNWCSYAGADLAGTSRIQYPPNVRIIRLMCSGRVDPAFILRAFEIGVDGVLVSGCHPADCHYISGNEKAEIRVNSAKRILKLLGLESERLRLEWISASEGGRFAEIIRDFTEELQRLEESPFKVKLEPGTIEITMKETFKRTNIRYCLQCGECTSICPIARVDPKYSPRETVNRILTGPEGEILSDKSVWSCLTCGLCTERCPEDVNYPLFIRNLRVTATKMSVEHISPHNGIPLMVSRMMVSPRIKQNRLEWLPEEAQTSKQGDVLYFVGCLPYYNVFFEDLDFKGTKIAQSAIMILNKIGIKPVVLENERCCGHDLLWNGDVDNFERLAKLNLKDIEETRASKVIFSCPEGYDTIKKEYAKFFGDLGFETLHISEFLLDFVEKGKLKFDARIPKKVTYQDPCRLGRHQGIYDAPRKIVTSIPGIELVEMGKSRENAECCGVSAWINCNQFSDAEQIKRLEDIQNTGADILITACPKCQIHLKCAMSRKTPSKLESTNIEICDLTELIAEAMNLNSR